jgi:hypothetical protein
MEIDNRMLHNLLSHSNRVTVALYGGLPNSSSAGRLTIAACGGRWADESAWSGLLGKGNVVDGPALRWLNRQAGKRVWISDKHVTGVGDRGSFELSRDAESQVRQGRIRVFPSLSSYLGSVR